MLTVALYAGAVSLAVGICLICWGLRPSRAGQPRSYQHVQTPLLTPTKPDLVVIPPAAADRTSPHRRYDLTRPLRAVPWEARHGD